jgi:hypothetical protein
VNSAPAVAHGKQTGSITRGTARKSVLAYTEKASSIVRSLGLAGIGIIWVFRETNNGSPQVPHALFAPGILLVAGLAADLLHYVVGSITWGIINSYAHYKKLEDDNDSVTGETWQTVLVGCIWAMWAIKIGLIMFGYLLLISYLLHHL